MALKHLMKTDVEEWIIDQNTSFHRERRNYEEKNRAMAKEVGEMKGGKNTTRTEENNRGKENKYCGGTSKTTLSSLTVPLIMISINDFSSFVFIK